MGLLDLIEAVFTPDLPPTDDQAENEPESTADEVSDDA